MKTERQIIDEHQNLMFDLESMIEKCKPEKRFANHKINSRALKIVTP